MTPYVTDEKPTPQDSALLAAQGPMPHAADERIAATCKNPASVVIYRRTLRSWRVVSPSERDAA
jgi:hypothetical protein